ncbi:CopD family protein [Nonomuraea sp. GTA35]|uniref:CopD family protein n=1 Tax=Nonomuraea sp. GTA35 TaxID=1676746 RepID=UPI0035C1F5DC
MLFRRGGVSGVANVWVRLGAVEQLWQARYGLLILVKVVLLAVLGVFGWTHRAWASRARGQARGVHQSSERSATRFRRPHRTRMADELRGAVRTILTCIFMACAVAQEWHLIRCRVRT